MITTSLRPRRFRRRGYTLIIFVMLVFGIFALAALTIDIGFARLAQRQMQTAVDSAALEGLRGRDRESPEAEENRRQAASDMIAWTFDDDLDPPNGDLRNFGAGPIFELTGTVGDPSLVAGQYLTMPVVPVYKPTSSDGDAGLELNLGDEVHGDMVAGEFKPDEVHDDEAADYQRSDFIPYQQSNSANDEIYKNAFLVRMRRTNNLADLDQEAGKSSSGPTQPYLFGRGSLLSYGEHPITGYSPRRDGITVRATAIASARPALSVGRMRGSQDLPGAAPWVLFHSKLDNFDENNESETITVTIDSDGSLVTTMPIGHVTHADGTGELTAVGQILSKVAIASPSGFVAPYLALLPPAPNAYAYVPIVADNVPDLPPNCVIGFWYVDQLAEAPNGFTFRKRTGMIAAKNASTALAIPLNLTDAQFEVLWQEHKTLSESDSLQAPASVR